MSRAHAALRTLVAHALMERCLACGVTLACGGDCRGPVCSSCRSRLELITGRRCPTCSRQLLSEKDRCTRCRNRDYAFAGNTSLLAYAGAARRLLYHYKFKARTRLADLFAEALDAAGLVDGDSFVIPVPARPRSLLQRTSTGFDQTGLIARSLRRRTGCTVHNALRRSPGPPQKRLDYDARSRNVAGRIRAATSRPLPERVTLLDDVFTTGATAHECARVLARCGVRETRVVTVALG
ncbi:MAG: ComF family protein [Spirochaetaceae bacterium]|nr:ComF family protein [Spirochaetaceae bacterium]